MARGGNHEYTELADMTGLPDGASEARVYQAQAGQTARRISRLSALLQDPEVRRHFMLSGTYILLWYTFSGVLS
ncbi:hypothetical protein IWW55_005458, partial [Coemansia sp. RSA 2706]